MRRFVVSAFFVLLMLAEDKGMSCEKEYDLQWDKKIVEIIKYNSRDSTYYNHGTGLLVKTYDTTFPQVLLSNRHILQDRNDLWIRVNLKDTTEKKVDTVSLQQVYSLSSEVKYPADENLDLAALPIPILHVNWDVLVHVKSLFASDAKRGTEIYYLGFPASISTGERSTPIYRSGVIALDREYLHGEYLIDGMVIQGSSGSPVFNCDGKLLGILHGHVNYSSNVSGFDIFGPSVRIDASLRLNSGLGLLIPVDRLIEFLEEISPGWSNR